MASSIECNTPEPTGIDNSPSGASTYGTQRLRGLASRAFSSHVGPEPDSVDGAMAETPLERLTDAAQDVWADPVAAAHSAAQAILELFEGDWSGSEMEAISELRRRRADSPYFLVVTQAASALSKCSTGLAPSSLPARIGGSSACNTNCCLWAISCLAP